MKQCKKLMPGGKAANRRRLKDCRDSGITHLGLLTTNLTGHACAAADALANKRIPINEIPELPLAGCDAESCGCIWIAVQ
jgi:hypothetical protein